MKKIILTVVVVVALALLFIFAFNGVKNRAIDYEEQIEEASSNITVQEKRRADLIPNLVDCVKDYNRHEYEVLLAVIEARKADNASEDQISTEVQQMISVVAEAYPELKSNTNYQNLMLELSTTENLIAQYRMNYNSIVKNYRAYVRKFPNSFVLPMLGYDIADYKLLTFEDVSTDAPTGLFQIKE